MYATEDLKDDICSSLYCWLPTSTRFAVPRILRVESNALFYGPAGKGKGKRGFVQHLVVNTPLRRSDTARVLKGSRTPAHPGFIR